MPSPKKPSATSETTPGPGPSDSSNSSSQEDVFILSQIRQIEQMAGDSPSRLDRIYAAYGLPPDASEWDVMRALHRNRSMLKSIPY